MYAFLAENALSCRNTSSQIIHIGQILGEKVNSTFKLFAIFCH